ncbi:sodium- and chloride-dependent GABA transporter ine-like isoform X3 [Dermacentor albipictus]|uniref:sodium- and chloride-dependent GABA transporter ine-like isoform X3 n=1 Tax=Dermacentor albipictus TaxID=60249 RepID=UPI0038FBE76E
MSGGMHSVAGLPLVPSARPERRLWGSELQLTLSCASIGIGLVSAWRLPALLYDNGGGSFLLAYTMLLLLLGYPLLYLELLLGHYARLGPGALTRCLPIAKGVEVSIALVCACAAASMGSVMAQAVLHLLLAFSELPPRWAGCQGFWEKKPLETCFHPGSRRLCAPGQATKHCVNVTESVNEHFFHTSLGMVTGSDQQAGVRPELVCCLAAAWALAWAALRRRSPSSALVLPIAMVALLAVGTAWLTGASRGLMYLFMPRLADIVKPALWARAAEQVLLVLGLAHGPALANGSYCRELHDVHNSRANLKHDVHSAQDGDHGSSAHRRRRSSVRDHRVLVARLSLLGAWRTRRTGLTFRPGRHVHCPQQLLGALGLLRRLLPTRTRCRRKLSGGPSGVGADPLDGHVPGAECTEACAGHGPLRGRIRGRPAAGVAPGGAAAAAPPRRPGARSLASVYRALRGNRRHLVLWVGALPPRRAPDARRVMESDS